MRTATERGVPDVEVGLQCEADRVAERFPDVPRATVDAAIREAYQELSATASVRAHLFTVTGSVVMNRLRAQGATFRRTRRGQPTH
jgi:hypothetical protein